MLMFTLVISCLTMYSLPWFLDLNSQAPMQYCFYSIGLYFHHQTHPQLSVTSALTNLLHSFWKVKVKVTQLCPALCDLMDYTVHGILQARILEWVAYPFSRRSSWPRNRTAVSCTTDEFFTNWAIREAKRIRNLLIQELRENEGLLLWLSGRESACQCRRDGFNPWSGKTPHATGQLSPRATSTDPTCCDYWSPHA